jgi:acetyl/propionyl-CoA carboxylase alpha subunit
MRFRCSYAYDISCYRDFIVEAPDEAAAQKLMDEALAAGKFDGVTASSNFDSNTVNHRCFDSNTVNHRCFVSGPEDNGIIDPTEPTLEQVLAEG